MAPQRVRGPPEDFRSEPSNKPSNNSPILSSSKGRRTATAQASSSNLKDVITNPAESEDQTKQQTGSEGSNDKMDWSNIDSSLLHSYRHAYRLNTPSAYTSAYNQLVLTGPGPGRFSPTMARPKDKRRVSKEHLTLAVRKDFNAAAVSEQEVVTSFLYSIHNQDKKFRMRFTPAKNK